MYVFPGRPYNCRVEFKAGADPVAPVSASFRVIDTTSELVPPTTIPVDGVQMDAWITVDGSVNTLGVGEKYSQHRVEVTHISPPDSLEFDQMFTYFVVPDLMLPFDLTMIRTLIGLSGIELRDDEVEFYRSYIDLAGGEYGDAFIAALASTNESLANAAKQLILYHTLIILLPTLRLKAVKRIESENSVIERSISNSSFEGIENIIKERYTMYLTAIKVAFGLGTGINPTLLVLSTPVDPITGA